MQRKFTFLTYGVIRIIYNLNIFPISYSYVVLHFLHNTTKQNYPLKIFSLKHR